MGHAINHAYMKDTRGHVPWKQATHDLWGGGGKALWDHMGPCFRNSTSHRFCLPRPRPMVSRGARALVLF